MTARARADGECEPELFSNIWLLTFFFLASARFKGSKFDNKQDIEALAGSFDAGLKTTFSDNTKQQYIKFGSPRDNNVGCGVKNGKFSVSGYVMCFSCITNPGCDLLVQESGRDIL